MTPSSHIAKTPNMTIWAWPTTQSVKWISAWNVSVVWNEHCKQVRK